MYKLNKNITFSSCVKNACQSFLRLKKSNFSDELTMPIIDFKKFLNKGEGWEKECKTTAECLHETGILVVKDPVNYFLI